MNFSLTLPLILKSIVALQDKAIKFIEAKERLVTKCVDKIKEEEKRAEALTNEIRQAKAVLENIKKITTEQPLELEQAES